MENNKKIILASGKELVITPASFVRAKALYQAVLDEFKSVKIESKEELGNVMKDMACVAFASKKIESALEECMKSVLYDGKKVNADTFEPVDARADYVPVCFEVAQENISPFLKSLYAQFSPLLEKLESTHA